MMTEKFSLQLEPRTVVGKAVKKLRREGVVPVGVFGKGIEPFNAQVNEREFLKVLREAGLTSLVEIRLLDREPQQVFIQEVQRHPVTRRILHADLHVVDLRTEVTHHVPVVVIGENSLVERGDAVVNVGLHVLEVRCLPTDLPHQVNVDISGLELGQAIHVRDINLGDKVQIMTSGDETILSLTPARMAVEEEVAEAAEEGEAAEPELIRQERDKEEEE